MPLRISKDNGVNNTLLSLCSSIPTFFCQHISMAHITSLPEDLLALYILIRINKLNITADVCYTMESHGSGVTSSSYDLPVSLSVSISVLGCFACTCLCRCVSSFVQVNLMTPLSTDWWHLILLNGLFIWRWSLWQLEARILSFFVSFSFRFRTNNSWPESTC